MLSKDVKNVTFKQGKYYVSFCRYGMDTIQHLTNKERDAKLIPFEFTIKLPDTQLFGNELKVLTE